MTKRKAAFVRLGSLSGDNTAQTYHALTQRDVSLLSTAAQLIRFRPRYDTLYAQETLNDVYNEVVSRLLTPVELPTIEVKVNFNGNVGEIVYFHGPLPDGVVPCDGRILNRVDYPELYNYLDLHNSFLVVDADTFNVPDLSNYYTYNDAQSPDGASAGQRLGSNKKLIEFDHLPPGVAVRQISNQIRYADTSWPLGESSFRGGVNNTAGAEPINSEFDVRPASYVLNVGIVAIPSTLETVDCSNMLNCLNDPDVIEAINNLISDYLEEMNVFIDDFEGEEPQNSLDCVYGGALAVAEYLRDETLVIIAELQGAADSLEASTQWLGKFPNTSGAVLAAMVDVAPSVLNLEAARISSQSYLEELACEIFCDLILTADNPLYPNRDHARQWQASMYSVNISDIVRNVVVSLETNKLLSIFNFGLDECDNNWQLCPCVEYDEFTVSSNGNTVSQVFAFDRVVTLTGLIKYQNSTTPNPNHPQLPSGYDDGRKLRWRNPGGSWQGLGTFFEFVDAYSESGYTFKMPAGSYEFYYNDGDYADNDGVFTMRHVLDKS